MRTATDALRSLHHVVWQTFALDTVDFSGSAIDWEVRYWSTEGENRFPFIKVAAITPIATSGGAAQRDVMQTFAVHCYPKPQEDPEATVMEAARVAEILHVAFEEGFAYVEPMGVPRTPYAIGVNQGGALAADTYAYRVTAVNATGETLPSAPALVTVPAGGYVSLAWLAVDGAATYNVYRVEGAGVSRLLASVAANVYMDTGASAGTVANPPVASAATATVRTAPHRVPLYDYAGVPLDGPDSVSYVRAPSDHLKVTDCPISRVDDPEDDRYTLVIAEPRLSWRRTGRVRLPVPAGVSDSETIVQSVKLIEAGS